MGGGGRVKKGGEGREDHALSPARQGLTRTVDGAGIYGIRKEMLKMRRRQEGLCDFRNELAMEA